MRALIRQGADADAHFIRDPKSYCYRFEHTSSFKCRTVLHVALKKADVSVTRMLIDAGADVNIMDGISSAELTSRWKYPVYSHIATKVSPLVSVCYTLYSSYLPVMDKRLCHCIVLLARAGCRLDIKDRHAHSLHTPVNILADKMHLHFIGIAVKILLALGDSIGRGQTSLSKLEFSINQKKGLEKEILCNRTLDTVKFLLESGFRFSSYNSKRCNSSVMAAGIEEAMRTPLTLQRLAANVIRLSLRPNAHVGVKKLPLPPMFDSNFILLDVDIEKFEAETF